MADTPQIDVKYGADTAGIKRGTDDAVKQIEALRHEVENVQHSFERVGQIIGLSFTIEGIKQFVDWMTELGTQTERTAAIFGITTEQVGQLNYVAQATGGSGESLVRSLERLALGLERADSASNPVVVALKALGLSADALRGKELPEILELLRDRFAKLPDGLTKTAIAQALVRNGAESLLPILRLSKEAWDGLIVDFNATGAALDEKTAHAFDATGRRLLTMREALTGLAITIFSGIEPAIDGLIQGFTNLVEGINNELKHNELLQAALQLLVYAVDSVAAGVLTIGAAFVAVWEIASTVIQDLNEGLTGIAKSIYFVLTGQFQAAADASKTAWDKIKTNTVNGAETIKGVLQGYSDLVLKMFGIGGQAPPTEVTVHPGGGGGGGLNFPPGPKNPFETALDDAGKQASGLRAQAEALNMSTAAGIRYTEQQKLRAIATAAGVKLTESDNVAIDAQADAISEATVRLQYMQSVQEALKDLASGITDAFMGWINGTEDLGLAFRKLAAQIALAVIQALILDAIMSALGLALPTQGLGAVFAPLFGGGKAQGGPLEPGKWYIAGERGPEPIWGGGPGAFAGGYPANSGSAGPQITYAPVIQALDSSGVSAVLSKHGEKFARHIAGIFNRQPSTRPSF